MCDFLSSGKNPVNDLLKSYSSTESKPPVVRMAAPVQILAPPPVGSSSSSDANIAPKAFYSSTPSSKIVNKVEGKDENLLKDIDCLQLGKSSINSSDPTKNGLKRSRQDSSDNLAASYNKSSAIFARNSKPTTSCITTHKRACTDAANKKMDNFVRYENQENLESPVSPLKKWNYSSNFYGSGKTSGKG